MNIKLGVCREAIKIIFKNADYKRRFLAKIQVNAAGNLDTAKLDALIERNWNYERSLKAIRSLFLETDKYKSGLRGDEAVKSLIKEWHRLNLGDISWPFSQGQFDAFVQGINNRDLSGEEKDSRVRHAAVQYRRLKEINTFRNDYLETLIFLDNKNICPTLGHSRKADFFINGIKYDQKVAKSPTNQFKRAYGERWKEEAISNPAVVAKFLYQYQDEGRFDADPRLLIVYLDENVSPGRIKAAIHESDLTNPISIQFEFNHRAQGIQNYNTQCFVVLLHDNLT